MYATATLTQAAEMTLPSDNGCYTTTFPYCTRRPRVNTAKSKTRLKFLIKKIIYFVCQQPLKFLLQFSFISFLFIYCRGSFKRYLFAKIAFSMTSRLNYFTVVLSEK